MNITSLNLSFIIYKIGIIISNLHTYFEAWVNTQNAWFCVNKYQLLWTEKSQVLHIITKHLHMLEWQRNHSRWNSKGQEGIERGGVCASAKPSPDTQGYCMSGVGIHTCIRHGLNLPCEFHPPRFPLQYHVLAGMLPFVHLCVWPTSRVISSFTILETSFPKKVSLAHPIEISFELTVYKNFVVVAVIYCPYLLLTFPKLYVALSGWINVP